MRILHVYRTYFPDTQGGLEEVIRQICSGTSALGVSNTVITTSKVAKSVERLTYAGTEVVRVPETFELASCNVSVRAVSEFKKEASRCDIIHYHFPWPYADVLNLLARSEKPKVVTYHSDIIRQRALRRLYYPLMRNFLRSAHRIVCTSPNYFATSNALSNFAEKVDVIPIGLDRDTYPSPPKSVLDEVETKYGSDFFLFVGVLRYYKGLHILLDALKGAPFRVIIVGSGPTETQLKNQARSLGLTNVEFTGHVTNETKVALFQLSKAVVFPSYLRSEAFGVTLLEGAMHGRALISTEVGTGTSHVNVHGETGMVVSPGSSKSLRTAMDALDSRPDLTRLMGRRAKERFDRLFTGKIMAHRYENLYRELTTQTPKITDSYMSKSA